MIDPRDILGILNDMARREASTDTITEVYEKLAGEGLPPDMQKTALQIIAGQKIAESQVFDKDIRAFVLSITGVIGFKEIVAYFDAKGEQKRKVYDILQQMELEGHIVRTGTRHGAYRLIDKNPRIMDLSAPEVERVKIELPFLLHDLVTLYPKNIILVSGEKDAGKTAFAMNTAYMNRESWAVRYFNSEMGVEELRGRLRKFNYPMKDWEKVTWVEQANQFEDHIDPNGLNIIDFLEVGAEAYTVTEDIRRVFDKLDRGILLIVMQKRSYKEYAVGGEGTLEKARLAVNLEHKDGENLARITVAKNWHGNDNPKWKVCNYNVFSGGVMKMDKYWHDPDKETGVKAKKGFTKKPDYNLCKTDPDFPVEE